MQSFGICEFGYFAEIGMFASCLMTINDDWNPYEVVLKNGQVLNMYIYDQMKLQVELLKE